MLDQNTLDEIRMIDESSEDEENGIRFQNNNCTIVEHRDNEASDSYCDNNILQNSRKKRLNLIIFTGKKCFSIFLYLIDVFSDLYLAGFYFYNSQLRYAVATLVIYLFSSIIITILSSRRLKELPLNSVKNVFIFVWIVLLNMEPVLCYVKCTSLRLREVPYFYNRIKGEEYNAAQLRLYEGCLEAIPQLILQLTISASESEVFEWNRSLTIVTSFIGLVYTAIVYYNRLAWDQQMQILPLGYFMLAVMHAMWFVSRFLSVALVLTVHLAFISIPLLHWMCLFIYEFKNYPSTFCFKLVYATTEAFSQTFCPFITYFSKCSFLGHIIIVQMQNIILVIIWTTQNEHAIITCGIIIINVGVGVILNIIWKYRPEWFAAVKEGGLLVRAHKWIAFFSTLNGHVT